MDLLNEKVRHAVYGEGTVIDQNSGRLAVQFSEPYGVKQFVYPDAFESYLKLCDRDAELFVLKELEEKQKQIEAERLLKQQELEQEENNRKMALQKAKSDGKKTSRVRRPKPQSNQTA